MTEPVPRVTTGGTVGPVDATQVPRYAARAPSPGCPDWTRWNWGRPTWPSWASRSTAGSATAPAPASARPTSASPPACSARTTPRSGPGFASQQVADAGDIAVNPFSIDEAITAVERGARALLERAPFVLTLGGDHTIALPLLRAVSAVHGPVAVVHFDAHLDTWDTYFGAAYTHGTPFRRAAEENLLDQTGASTPASAAPCTPRPDLAEDADLGFQVVSSPEMESIGVSGLAERIAARVGDRPVYVSVDIDVLDPAHAPGTGTPKPAA